jgi:DNA-binding PadR family transcriptional regulator
MMVLGLVVRQPDTVSGVARRLADEFASAQFPKSSAYTNMPALRREGYLRLVEHGAESSLDRYEATPAGVEHLRGWVRRSNPSPALRDALQGKLDFLELEELGALIHEVREQERTYRSACEAVHARLLQEQETRRRIRARGKPIDWRTRLRSIQTQDELALWGTMIQRLEQLRESLEQLLQEITIVEAGHTAHTHMSGANGNGTASTAATVVNATMGNAAAVRSDAAEAGKATAGARNAAAETGIANGASNAHGAEDAAIAAVGHG